MLETCERILSVDDDPHLLELLKLYLEESGFEVITTTKPTEALKIFEEIKPDLVLADLHMPAMRGMELLSSLKNVSPHTPVVILSGQSDMSDAIDALQLGASDYLLKPFSKISLNHAVSRALGKFKLTNGVALHTGDKNIQKLLFPKEEAQFDGYFLSYKAKPSHHRSSDFIDYFKINERYIAFYIANISGQDKNATLDTIMLKGMIEKIQENFQRGNDDCILHPEKMLKEISDNLFFAHVEKSLTMIYCVLDLNENTLTYSVGGHYPNPILYNGEKAIFLEGQGFSVGAHQEAIFESRRCDLPLRFTFAMFSNSIFGLIAGKDQSENEKNLLNLVKKSSRAADAFTLLEVNQINGNSSDVACLFITKDNLYGHVSH